MSRTYKATGINLKGMPMGETDRLLTILTPEQGLVRVIAPGARKHRSRLGGRSGLFVVNELLIASGRRLDKLIQAETVRSFPGLSQQLGRLTASQYLAELALFQATDQPQQELYVLLLEHLERIEASSLATLLPCLVQGTYHLLALAGVAPEVRHCCLTREPLVPDFNPVQASQWGFNPVAGGVFLLEAAGEQPLPPRETTRLGSLELALLQQLSQPQLLASTAVVESQAQPVAQNQVLWSRLERILRQYAQYQFDRPIRSAALIDVVSTG